MGELAFAWIVQASVALAGGIVAAFLWRKRPAAAHAMLFLSIVAVLALPLASWGARVSGVGFLPPVADAGALTLDVAPALPPPHVDSPAPSRQPASSAPTSRADAASSIALPLPTLTTTAWLCWIALSFVALVRLICGVARGVSIRRRSFAIDSPCLAQALAAAQRDVGLHRHIELRASHELSCPVICCWGKPCVLVPVKAPDDIDWRAVMAHELAHLARRDHWSSFLVELVCCALSWNPLAWLARRRLSIAAEQACDDWAVHSASSRSSYADALVAFVPQRNAPRLAHAMASGGGVTARVARVLSERRDARLGTFTTMLISLVALASIGVVALARPRTAPPQAERLPTNDVVKVVQSPGPNPKERYDMMLRMMAEVTLKRDRLLAAIGHLDRDLAAMAVDEAFREYAETVGAAQDKLMKAHFTIDADRVSTSTRTNEELRQFATEYGNALRDATDKLAKDIAAAGATKSVPAERVEADIYRAIVANVHQGAMEGSSDPSHPGYEVLRGFDEAQAVDPMIGEAAARAAKDEASSRAFDAALATYRDAARNLGRACIEGFGDHCFSGLTYHDPPRPEPPDQDRRRDEMRKAQLHWRVINDQLSDAIEQYLRSDGDETPAAAWRLRNYAIVSRGAVPSGSWVQAIVDNAGALGVSDEEMTALQVVLHDSLVERANAAKAVVLASRRMAAEAAKTNTPVFFTDPPEDLLKADDRRIALDKSLRDRAIACVRSSLTKSDLEAVAPPMDPATMWRAIHEQRQAAKAAPKEEQPR